MQEAVFGLGDFWLLEDALRDLEGVLSSCVGYAGREETPRAHEDVVSGVTGHALVVRVSFDPSRISYDELLSAFWNTREDAVYTRSYRDDDPQRAVIFYSSAPQKETAEQAVQSLFRAHAFGGSRISVQIEPLGRFFPAVAMYQRYSQKKEA